MPRSMISRAAVAATLLVSTASAGNVAVYWGQGNGNKPLADLCADPAVKIVNLAFVTEFPKNVGDYPKTNFGNACWGDVYTDPKTGNDTPLLKTCPTIAPGIQICRDNRKKVMLSLGGGAAPADYSLPNESVALWFAQFLVGAFGPPTKSWVDAGKPRPFGDMYVDGFDLDLEADVGAVGTNALSANYGYFVNQLKAIQPSLLISAAPQCEVPDVRLADAISKAPFDMIFTQFYNTPKCSARLGYQQLNSPTTGFSFNQWADWIAAHSYNKNAKLFIGLPAGPDGAGAAYKDHYLNPKEANDLVTKWSALYPDTFGGIMLWEAAVSANNLNRCQTYSYWMRAILDGTFTVQYPIGCSLPSTTSSIRPSTTSSVRPSSTSLQATTSSKVVSSSASSSVVPTSKSASSSVASSASKSASSSVMSSTSQSASSSVASSTSKSASSSVVSSTSQSASSSVESSTSKSASSSVMPSTSQSASSSATTASKSSSLSIASSSASSVVSSSASASASAPSSVASSSAYSASSSIASSSAASSSAASSSAASSSAASSSVVSSSTLSVGASSSMASSSAYPTSSSMIPASSSNAGSSVASSSVASSSIASSTAVPASSSVLSSSSVSERSSVYATASGSPKPTPESSSSYSVGVSSSMASSSQSSSVTLSVVYSADTTAIPSASSPSDTPAGASSTPYSTSSSEQVPSASVSSSQGSSVSTSSTLGVSSTPCSTSSLIVSYSTGSSSIAYPSSIAVPVYNISSTYGVPGAASSTPLSTSSSVYVVPSPSSVHLASSSMNVPVHGASSSAGASTTSCSTSGNVHATSSSSLYVASSSSHVYIASSSSVVPLAPSSSAYPVAAASSSSYVYTASPKTSAYPVAAASSKASEYPSYPESSKAPEHPAYPEGPKVSAGASSTIKIITTTYMDSCSTGLTTVTATITKTICNNCAQPTKDSVTSIYVCNNCGPSPVTVTITKPNMPATNVPSYPTSAAAVSAKAASSVYGGDNKPSQPAQASSSVYVVDATASQPPAQAMSSTPSSVNGMPNMPVYSPAIPEQPKKQEASTTISIVIVTPVPVMATLVPYPSAPAGAKNSTMGYPTATGTGAPTKPTSYVPPQFEGAASHLSVGLTGLVAIVAGLLAL